MIQRIDAVLTHFSDKSDSSNENSVIFFSQQTPGRWQKHLHEFRHTSDYSERTERCFFSDIRVR